MGQAKNKFENRISTNIAEGGISGRLSADGDVMQFLAIPYARPPIGAFRFRPAEPIAAWDGVRECAQFGPRAPQPELSPRHLLFQFQGPASAQLPQSEDCLTLNVWAPTRPRNAPLPVLVLLHGGGNRLGSGANTALDGAALARQGMVVITVTHRLGALGFLAHPALSQERGASGNYALTDVIEALRWVQRNAGSFGGDQRNVTLVGQSSGAAMIAALMAAPAARHLFLRVVATSGGRFDGGPMGHISDLSQAEAQGAERLSGLRAATAEDLRALPAAALVDLPGRWNLTIDGQTLTSSISETFKHQQQAKVSVMAGFTRDDASAYAEADLHSREGLLAAIRAEFAEQADAVAALYPAQTDAEARDQSFAYLRDRRFAYQAHELARMHRAGGFGGAPVFLFRFDAEPALSDPEGGWDQVPPPKGFGAYHGAELWYLLGNLDRAPFAVSDADRALSARMVAALAAFARTGDPNYADDTRWPPYLYGRLPREAMIFATQGCRAEPLDNLAALDLFHDLATSQQEIAS